MVPLLLYFFLFAEAMIDEAEKRGMANDNAKQLVLQAMKGAALLAQRQPQSLKELRQAVTSPGGTTQAALETLFEAGVDSSIANAVNAAVKRGQELGQ